MTSIRHRSAVQGTHILAPHQRFPIPPVKTYSRGIDWIAVERAARGELRAEVREAAMWMVRAGQSRIAVSIQLCVYERIVKQWEAEEGLLPPSEICIHPRCRRFSVGRKLCTLHLQRQHVLERKERAARGLGVAA